MGTATLAVPSHLQTGAIHYYAWISRELNADNILRWLGGTSEYIYRWHEQYSVAVHKIAQAGNVKLIDIRSAFLVRRDYRDYLSGDGIHPNEQGHLMISKNVLQQILHKYGIFPVWLMPYREKVYFELKFLKYPLNNIMEEVA